MAYATKEERELAESLGFERETNVQFGDRFKKNERHVWFATYAYVGWQTADLIDGRFCNHQKFRTLTEALNRPLRGEP
ncbi:hypothetical protein [Ectothiorhodospira shaposhnikovii]|uniref:hypothetical protein n=1 Tax=Ectothiorhodospira shaposhnikovii TaxID=1054 RepID=UPI001EE95B5E|nr:hypothetical protein [Ectothiorhodospira shaposhnikovii]MCG5512809.1 hypothetical protein [Ectothiorhodospira shaposhnikovii]